ncbi:hypothetical protein AAK899_05740 [Erysipelotrichaceae bacterium 51-3]
MRNVQAQQNAQGLSWWHWICWRLADQNQLAARLFSGRRFLIENSRIRKKKIASSSASEIPLKNRPGFLNEDPEHWIADSERKGLYHAYSNGFASRFQTLTKGGTKL